MRAGGFILLLASLLPLPALRVAAQVPTNPVLAYLPHVPYGGGYRTKITIVNLTASPNSGVVNFISQAGALVRSQNWSAAASGMVRMDTENVFSNSTFAPLNFGWAVIGAQGGIAANLFYEYNPSSSSPAYNIINSVGFNDAALQSDFTVPFEQEPQPAGAMAGKTVGVAAANPGSTAATLTIKLIDAAGTTRATDSIQVPAYGQVAFAFPDATRLPNITAQLPNANFMGMLSGHATRSLAVIALQDDYGPFSATPTMPGLAPSTLTGTWQFTAVSSIFPITTTGTGTLQQNGTSVTGQLTLSGTPCATTAALTGTINGTNLTFQLNENGQPVSFTGTANANLTSASGNYSAQAGGCTSGDFGTWTAAKQ